MEKVALSKKIFQQEPIIDPVWVEKNDSLCQFGFDIIRLRIYSDT